MASGGALMTAMCAVAKDRICSSSAYVLFYRRRHEAQQESGTTFCLPCQHVDLLHVHILGRSKAVIGMSHPLMLA